MQYLYDNYCYIELFENDYLLCSLKMYFYFVDFLRNGYEVLKSDGFTFSATSDGKVAYSIKIAMFKTDLSIFSAYCSLYCKKFHN